MGDTFVDLTYRGLALGRRVKLAQVRPSTAYLELPAPMPVGTTIGILTDDTVALDAVVIEVREQVGGSEGPGMLVRPRLSGDVANAWWSARVTMPELPPKAVLPAAPILPAQASTVVMPKRRTLDGVPAPAVPELLDDGQNTSVMQAVDPDEQSIPVVQDDGRQTIAMSAVDLAALGLEPSARTTTGQIPVVTPDDDGDDNGNGDKPESKSKKKRRRR